MWPFLWIDFDDAGGVPALAPPDFIGALCRQFSSRLCGYYHQYEPHVEEWDLVVPFHPEILLGDLCIAVVTQQYYSSGANPPEPWPEPPPGWQRLDIGKTFGTYGQYDPYPVADTSTQVWLFWCWFDDPAKAQFRYFNPLLHASAAHVCVYVFRGVDTGDPFGGCWFTGSEAHGFLDHASSRSLAIYLGQEGPTNIITDWNPGDATRDQTITETLSPTAPVACRSLVWTRTFDDYELARATNLFPRAFGDRWMGDWLIGNGCYVKAPNPFAPRGVSAGAIVWSIGVGMVRYAYCDVYLEADTTYSLMVLGTGQRYIEVDFPDGTVCSSLQKPGQVYPWHGPCAGDRPFDSAGKNMVAFTTSAAGTHRVKIGYPDGSDQYPSKAATIDNVSEFYRSFEINNLRLMKGDWHSEPFSRTTGTAVSTESNNGLLMPRDGLRPAVNSGNWLRDSWIILNLRPAGATGRLTRWTDHFEYSVDPDFSNTESIYPFLNADRTDRTTERIRYGEIGATGIASGTTQLFGDSWYLHRWRSGGRFYIEFDARWLAGPASNGYWYPDVTVGVRYGTSSVEHLVAWYLPTSPDTGPALVKWRAVVGMAVDATNGFVDIYEDGVFVRREQYVVSHYYYDNDAMRWSPFFTGVSDQYFGNTSGVRLRTRGSEFLYTPPDGFLPWDETVASPPDYIVSPNPLRARRTDAGVLTATGTVSGGVWNAVWDGDHNGLTMTEDHGANQITVSGSEAAGARRTGFISVRRMKLGGIVDHARVHGAVSAFTFDTTSSVLPDELDPARSGALSGGYVLRQFPIVDDFETDGAISFVRSASSRALVANAPRLDQLGSWTVEVLFQNFDFATVQNEVLVSWDVATASGAAAFKLMSVVASVSAENLPVAGLQVRRSDGTVVGLTLPSHYALFSSVLLTATYSAFTQTLCLYMNGVLAVYCTLADVAACGSTMAIGCGYTSGSPADHCEAKIQWVGVYGRALTQDEVTDRATIMSGGTTTDGYGTDAIRVGVDFTWQMAQDVVAEDAVALTDGLTWGGSLPRTMTDVAVIADEPRRAKAPLHNVVVSDAISMAVARTLSQKRLTFDLVAMTDARAREKAPVGDNLLVADGTLAGVWAPLRAVVADDTISVSERFWPDWSPVEDVVFVYDEALPSRPYRVTMFDGFELSDAIAAPVGTVTWVATDKIPVFDGAFDTAGSEIRLVASNATSDDAADKSLVRGVVYDDTFLTDDSIAKQVVSPGAGVTTKVTDDAIAALLDGNAWVYGESKPLELWFDDNTDYYFGRMIDDVYYASFGTTTNGWRPGTTAAGRFLEFQYGIERTGTWATTPTQPGSPGSSTWNGFINVSMGAAQTLSVVIPAGNWTAAFTVRAQTTGGSQDGRIKARLWRGTANDGSDAVEIGSVATGTTVTNLTTSTTQTSTCTWSLPEITLEDERLFVTLMWEITGAGSSTNCDVLLYADSTGKFSTPVIHWPKPYGTLFMGLKNTVTAEGFYLADIESGMGTSVTTATGWTVGTTGAGYFSEMLVGTERAESTFATSPTGPGAPNSSAANGFRSSGALSGRIPVGDWQITLSWKAATLGMNQDGRFVVRVWRGTASDGSNAVEIGSGLTSGVATNITSTGTSTIVAFGTLNDEVLSLYGEYLFFTVAWEITGPGIASTCDVLFQADFQTIAILPGFLGSYT